MTKPTRFYDYTIQEYVAHDFGMAKWLAAHEARNRKPEPAPLPEPKRTFADLRMKFCLQGPHQTC